MVNSDKSPLHFSLQQPGVIYAHRSEIVNFQRGVPACRNGFESLSGKWGPAHSGSVSSLTCGHSEGTTVT